MLKLRVAALIAISCFSGLASAAWGLKFEVWNGAAWVSNVNAAAGDVVKFRFGTYFDAGLQITTVDGTGAAAMICRCTGSNYWTNFNAGSDVIQNLIRIVSSGNAAFLTNTGNGTIGSTLATSFGSTLALATLPAEPVTYTNMYEGEVKIGDATPRIMTFQNKTFGVAPNTKGATFFNYGSAINKLPGAPDTPRTDFTASINVIPAPSAFALIGLGGLAVTRRRRV